MRFQPGTPTELARGVHASFGAAVVSRLPWLGVDVVELPPGTDPLAAVPAYERRADVAYAHPSWVYRVQESHPNDVLFDQQWNLHNIGQPTIGTVPAQAGADVDAPAGWEAAFGQRSFPSSGGARIAVIDTGIDPNQVELARKIKGCWSIYAVEGVQVPSTECFDGMTHGTEVAGIAAAQTNNLTGIGGVAPNAELVSVRAFHPPGIGFSEDIAMGIHHAHAVLGARVINMSFAGAYPDPTLTGAVQQAYAAGVVMVASAGNRGDDVYPDCPSGPTPDCPDGFRYPASYPEVISVGATDAADQLAPFTVCNQEIDLVAPGSEVWTTTGANAYALLSGTSISAPHVAGAAAMLVRRHPSASPAQIRQMIESAADDLGPAGPDTCFGSGRLNLGRAMTGATGAPN